MARTLYLLVGIIFVTASAYKCKHTSYANSDTDLRPHYDYANQEPIRIPENRGRDRINTRSDDVKSSQLRIEESMPIRSVGSRRGQNNDNYKIVFPESPKVGNRINIPEHCRRLGICEDIPDYPQDEANKIIEEIKDTTMFQNDQLDLPLVPDITQRVGPQEENIELCNFEKKVMYPKAAVDADGEWHLVLNKEDNPLQGFKVEICDVDSSPCSEVAIFLSGYEARCKQKYVYRKMAVIHEGSKLEKSLKVPSCCSCVAKTVIR